MEENEFIRECRKLSGIIEQRKGFKKTCFFIPECISHYEKNEQYAGVIDAHAEELKEIIIDDYYAFLGEYAIVPRVGNLEKRIAELVKKAGIRVGSGDTSERIRERKHLNKITDEEER